jgi:hypothetical protein
MLSVKSIVSVEVNGRNFEFSCPPDSPLPDVLEANNQINAFLLGRVQQAQQAQNKAAEEQKQPVE